MLDQVEELLKAGIWLGPAVLGSLCYRLVGDPAYSATDELAGVVLLATAALLLTFASVRLNQDKPAVIVPAVFAAMFVVSLFGASVR
jgi:hypothetical protein